jgi:hypothetical protein
MDPIFTVLLNGGIGLGMAALVIWHVWYTQTRQIPEERKAASQRQTELLKAFEDQMSKEREAANVRMTTEREISNMRHEDNIKQNTLMVTSLREVHHQLRNVGNVVSLLGVKIDLTLGLNKKIKDQVRQTRNDDEDDDRADRAREEEESIPGTEGEL